MWQSMGLQRVTHDCATELNKGRDHCAQRAQPRKSNYKTQTCTLTLMTGKAQGQQQEDKLEPEVQPWQAGLFCSRKDRRTWHAHPQSVRQQQGGQVTAE